MYSLPTSWRETLQSSCPARTTLHQDHEGSPIHLHRHGLCRTTLYQRQWEHGEDLHIYLHMCGASSHTPGHFPRFDGRCLYSKFSSIHCTSRATTWSEVRQWKDIIGSFQDTISLVQHTSSKETACKQRSKVDIQSGKGLLVGRVFQATGPKCEEMFEAGTKECQGHAWGASDSTGWNWANIKFKTSHICIHRGHVGTSDALSPNEWKKVAVCASPWWANQHRQGDELHCGTSVSRKRKEQSLIFKLGTLAPNGINERFSFS